jgi:CO/xanthine dehydrogenase Mo-binding subunit/aerobic-type carbon monoxide dehydrogenase small subunit (CoxS/CutS family)
VNLKLNGARRTFEVAPGRRLLDLLREDAGLTGTKEGCSAGECGACVVLLDGAPVTSCLVLAASADGHEVVTVEGLQQSGSLHPFQEALVTHGGVQCGFCTPGLAVTGAAALARSPGDAEERARLLAGNLCRCTGYVKVLEALERASSEEADHDTRRERAHFEEAPGHDPLGGHHERPDARAKVSGSTRYVADLAVPGMLHAAVAVAPVASACVVGLSLATARAIDGVEAVITAADLPGKNLVGVIFEDQPLLALERVRMVGERLALVAARSPESAWAAAHLVHADLEPLPAVHDPIQALAPDAPRVHDAGNLIRTFRVVRGHTACARASVVVEAEYRVGGQEHAYLEPQGCLAIPEGRQHITIVASCQCPFYVQQAVARVLGLSLAAVRVEQAPTGGGFGGKEDYPSELAACAAVLAFATDRPVRFVLPRELDMQVSSKRHAMVIRHRWGADRNGHLRFAEVETVLDAGAYIGISTVVAERANVSSIGPYHVPAVRVTTRVAYTNNLFGGAFRGFGAPQVTWAAEATMDRLARACALDPLEFRRRNLLDDRRRRTCTGQSVRRPVLARECLDRAAALAGWDEFHARTRHQDGPAREGMGIGLVLYGCNLHHGGQHLDRSSAVVILQSDGSVVVRVGLTEMGQGNLAACQTIAAQALGVDPAQVQVWQPDTTTVADSGPTVASRGAHASGMAILNAVERLRKRIDPLAAELLGCDERDVLLAGGFASARGDPDRRVPIARLAGEMASRRIEGISTGWYRSTERRFDAATGVGDPYEFYAIACHVAQVTVDAELGLVRVVEVSAAHDVGRVIHRDVLEGQIQGGVVQGIGWGTSEELKLDRGRLANPSFTDYIIPTSADVPRIRIAVVESEGPGGPFGAKGIGEPSLIPTAAAVRNAVVDALGIEIDRLPITPPAIVAALSDRHPFAWVAEEEKAHGRTEEPAAGR